MPLLIRSISIDCFISNISISINWNPLKKSEINFLFTCIYRLMDSQKLYSTFSVMQFAAACAKKYWNSIPFWWVCWSWFGWHVTALKLILIAAGRSGRVYRNSNFKSLNSVLFNNSWTSRWGCHRSCVICINHRPKFTAVTCLPEGPNIRIIYWYIISERNCVVCRERKIVLSSFVGESNLEFGYENIFFFFLCFSIWLLTLNTLNHTMISVLTIIINTKWVCYFEWLQDTVGGWYTK